MAEFFAQVLVLCARLGMGRLGTVALDGMKIAASASKAANRTEEGLRKLAAEAVAAHAAADAAEDALFGEGGGGDEVPRTPGSTRSRAGRIGAALAGPGGRARRRAEPERSRRRAEGFRPPAAGRAADRAARMAAAVALAEEKLARVTAAQQAKIEDWQARARGRGGRPGWRNAPPAPAEEHCRVREAAAR